MCAKRGCSPGAGAMYLYTPRYTSSSGSGGKGVSYLIAFGNSNYGDFYDYHKCKNMQCWSEQPSEESFREGKIFHKFLLLLLLFQLCTRCGVVNNFREILNFLAAPGAMNKPPILIYGDKCRKYESLLSVS